MKLSKTIIVILSSLIIAACSSGKTHDPFLSIQNSYNAGNYQEVIKRLRPLAENNNPRAQYMLGYMYYNGLGTLQDEELARVWIERAATQGDSQAINALEILNETS